MDETPDKVPQKRGPKQRMAYDDLRNEILQCISRGMNQKEACLACGVGYTSYKAYKGGDPEFFDQVEAARAMGKRVHVDNIHDISQDPDSTPDLKAKISMWWIERSDPARWGNRQLVRIEISSEAAHQALARAAADLDLDPDVAEALKNAFTESLITDGDPSED